jgi:hypothetical protein
MATKEEVFKALEEGNYNVSEDAMEAYVDWVGEHYIATDDAEDVCSHAEDTYQGCFYGAEEFAESLGVFEGVSEAVQPYIDYGTWWNDVKGDYIADDHFAFSGGHVFLA